MEFNSLQLYCTAYYNFRHDPSDPKKLSFCNIQEFREIMIQQISSYMFWNNSQIMINTEQIFINVLKFIFLIQNYNNIFSKLIIFRAQINNCYYFLYFSESLNIQRHLLRKIIFFNIFSIIILKSIIWLLFQNNNFKFVIS